MSYRVTSTEVREIIDLDASMTNLDAYIRIANLLVETNLVSTVTDTTLLKEIERNLSAHFACMRDPRIKSEAAGSVSATYAISVGLGLKGTVYGQTAMALDPTGKLALLDQPRKTASMKVLSP